MYVSHVPDENNRTHKGRDPVHRDWGGGKGGVG
jgi:hypothetical protein